MCTFLVFFDLVRVAVFVILMINIFFYLNFYCFIFKKGLLTIFHYNQLKLQPKDINTKLYNKANKKLGKKLKTKEKQ